MLLPLKELSVHKGKGVQIRTPSVKNSLRRLPAADRLDQIDESELTLAAHNVVDPLIVNRLMGDEGGMHAVG